MGEVGGLTGGAMDMLENVVYKGKSLIVTKSSESSTGYKNVIKLRTDANGPIYVAKFKVEGEPGQRNCPNRARGLTLKTCSHTLGGGTCEHQPQ